MAKQYVRLKKNGVYVNPNECNKAKSADSATNATNAQHLAIPTSVNLNNLIATFTTGQTYTATQNCYVVITGLYGGGYLNGKTLVQSGNRFTLIYPLRQGDTFKEDDGYTHTGYIYGIRN